jgi:hypothetical protein
MAPELPTRRCRVIDPENAIDEIRAFLEATPAGERAWCEVWYPAPDHRDAAEWDHDQHESFDAVELVDGEIVTLPPYAEILSGGAS